MRVAIMDMDIYFGMIRTPDYKDFFAKSFKRMIYGNRYKIFLNNAYGFGDKT